MGMQLYLTNVFVTEDARADYVQHWLFERTKISIHFYFFKITSDPKNFTPWMNCWEKEI